MKLIANESFVKFNTPVIELVPNLTLTMLIPNCMQLSEQYWQEGGGGNNEGGTYALHKQTYA